MRSVSVTTRIERRAQTSQPLPARPPLWFHLEDGPSGVWGGQLRPCAYAGGCPAPFVLREPRLKVNLDRHWQFYMAAINDGMVPEDVARELHYRLMACNMTGLDDPQRPRRDYLRGKNLTASEDPRFDKDRTCSRSVMTGTEGYSLLIALQAIVTAATVQRSLLATRSALVTVATNNVLIVTVLDGNQPPPLKPGKSYPQTVSQIDPDDYLYHPRTHRWLFFAANTVVSASGNTSKVWPFPRGATYPWTGDGWKYTWFPHVSRETIRYPLSRLRKLGPTEPIPSPYRST
jgi:hypothetical protein